MPFDSFRHQSVFPTSNEFGESGSPILLKNDQNHKKMQWFYRKKKKKNVYFLMVRCRLTCISKTPETMQSHNNECRCRSNEETYSVHSNVCRKHFNELFTKYHSMKGELSSKVCYSIRKCSAFSFDIHSPLAHNL